MKKKKISDTNKKLLKLHAKGFTQEQIASELKLHKRTIGKYFQDLRKEGLLTKENLMKENVKGAVDLDKVLEYLTEKGRTGEEIANKFKITEIKRILDAVKRKNKGYTLYNQIKRDTGETIYYLLKEDKRDFPWIKVKNREFSIKKSPNSKPYLWIKFKDNIPGKLLKLVPLADIHFGSTECKLDAVKKYIDWIASQPNVFAYMAGDLLECSHKGSVADGVYRQAIPPGEQVKEFVKLISPIAHKILFTVRGNHEKRLQNAVGLDPIQYMADLLDIPYYAEPVYVDYLWKKNVWTMFAQHGTSSSSKIGSKINSASSPIFFTEFTHFYVGGHTHDKNVTEFNRIIRNPQTFDLEFKIQYSIIVSAYLKFFGTYGAEAGYAPPSSGLVVCEMREDGSYRAQTHKSLIGEDL